MKKVIVLGSGMIGNTIAADLADEYLVTVVDRDAHKLNLLNEKHEIKTIISDLSSEIKIQEIIIDYDLIIGALPGYMGFKTLNSVISEGKNIVDISFFSEDPFELDEMAKEKNVTAVVDCGVSPGLSNIILGYHNERMKVDEYKCIVGGLPVKREPPFEYKAFFSPIDVIEEYKRPARIMEMGKLVTKDSMTDVEILEINDTGKLEAFNTDGLRTLLKTTNIPNMVEKTLRYPGHIKLMKVFRDAGFFNDEEIETGGKKIKPVDVSAKLLFPFWTPAAGDDDFTILTLEISGNGKKHTYSVYDKSDPETGISSMARTTGYTCTAVARLVLENKYDKKGIIPPEYIGADEKCCRNVLEYVSGKNIKIDHREDGKAVSL